MKSLKKKLRSNSTVRYWFHTMSIDHGIAIKEISSVYARLEVTPAATLRGIGSDFHGILMDMMESP